MDARRKSQHGYDPTIPRLGSHVMEQLAARIAPQGLGIAVPGDVHDLRGRRAGHTVIA
jgi:hypothetical protein